MALEISGVDIYVCQVKLKGEGGKLDINQYQYEIPDDLTAGNDIRVLIDYVADCVADFQMRVSSQSSQQKEHQTYSMAISLGFAVRQTGLDRGTIIALEHGFEYPNVIGCDVVDLFHSRFEAKGLNVRIVALANGKNVLLGGGMNDGGTNTYKFVIRRRMHTTCACISTPFHTHRHCSQHRH